ncbi:hypothetical protein ACFWVM_00965 [Nocardia fluminea]|uniref:hypothetical protein n=1 Tax=Nocardia fluminea TaxID=134984 RepID=UPI0036488BFD
MRPLLLLPPLRDLLDPRALSVIARQVPRVGAVPGGPASYSDGEFARIVEAARADVAAIRDRIDASERLMNVWIDDPSALSGAEAEQAARLVDIAATGVVPRVKGIGADERRARIALARSLYFTRADREALLVLMVAVTGRNSETVKELPAEHRILGENSAVELRVVKRRRGPQSWYDTVTWEIGAPHRQLHTPGGLYLLLHRLTARSRAISGSTTIWSIWRNAFRGFSNPDEHVDPFSAGLAASLNFKRWSAEHGLTADPVGINATRSPLAVSLRTVRTSVEVRRTRAVGGHLPSAARSNTTNVLFTNYLRGDASVRAWAEEVIGEAVADAEQAALAAHRGRLAGTGRTSVHVDPLADTIGHEGAWSACADPDAHPGTGRPCRTVSYLDCFHCGNCLITTKHLPAILALADDLADRRAQLDEQQWWKRYGPVWAAVRLDILPKFTPAQRASAAAAKPADALLELAEDPWEHP